MRENSLKWPSVRRKTCPPHTLSAKNAEYDAFGDIGANFQALEKLQFFTGRLRRKLNGGRSRALDRLLQIKTR
jgi:hypothetical protein